MATRSFAITLTALLCGVALWIAVQWFGAQPPAAEAAADRPCPPASDDTYYFPAGSFGQFLLEQSRRDSWDIHHREQYSAQLRAMEEPSLSCGSSDAETYRFLWLGSFDKPIAVRVTHTSARTVLVAVVLSGGPPDGSGPSAVERRIEKDLTTVEWKRIENGVERIGFWRLPTEDGSPPGLDGSSWTVEGRAAADHHVIDRRSGGDPKDFGLLKAFGLMMLELAGLPEADID